MKLVLIDGRRVVDEPTFHSEFAKALGFPATYGRNLDAWVDCVSTMRDGSGRMTSLHLSANETLVLQVDHVGAFVTHAPKLFAALHDLAAFVNLRVSMEGKAPIIALAYERE